MAEELNLGALVRDLRRRWRIATAVALAFVIGATLYAYQLPNSYQGRVVVAFAPRKDVNIGGDIVRQVLPKYVAYATARATLDRVANDLGERPAILRQAVTAGVAVDSGNLSITAELGSARRAADAANAVAAAVISFADVDPLLQAVIVAPALPESVPSGPPRTLIEAAALVVGVLLGAVGAYLLERGRPRLRTWRDVSVVTGLEVLGRLPTSRRVQGGPLAGLEDPAVGTAVRTLRTRLERVSRDRPVHVLMLTSSVAGEGKTTIACLLAASLVRLDASVLIIDADLRRPSLHRVLNVDAAPGLSEVLRGKIPLEQAIRPTTIPGLKVLATSPDTDAGDLLARHFGGLLSQARGLVDIIVLDAPPLLGTDDARTLASLAEGVLLVVGVGGQASAAAEAATVLEGLHTRVLGAVANRSRDDSRISSYGYVYDVQQPREREAKFQI
ncbi:MAG: tyrosine-protein kinase [Acidimicrobiaceae bacterium]|nr:tyrosine-protein kinase [Acidimicrobiaceae bacterium]